MAQPITIATKNTGDDLTALEFNQVVEKTNAAISEMNSSKTASDLKEQAQDAAIASKVDKVEGKGLSTEDFTTIEKEKLASLKGTQDVTYETLAANNVVGMGANQLAPGDHDHGVGDLVEVFNNQLV